MGSCLLVSIFPASTCFLNGHFDFVVAADLPVFHRGAWLFGDPLSYTIEYPTANSCDLLQCILLCLGTIRTRYRLCADRQSSPQSEGATGRGRARAHRWSATVKLKIAPLKSTMPSWTTTRMRCLLRPRSSRRRYTEIKHDPCPTAIARPRSYHLRPTYPSPRVELRKTIVV